MHTCTGRVLAYAPETKSVRQLADGLAFANGIALSEDEASLFAFMEDGTVTESLQSGSNDYYRSTGAAETAERLYIQPINNSGKLAYVERAVGQQVDKQN